MLGMHNNTNPTQLEQTFVQPHPNRTNVGHAIVLIRLLVFKIAKQGGGLMRTVWAW